MRKVAAHVDFYSTGVVHYHRPDFQQVCTQGRDLGTSERGPLQVTTAQAFQEHIST